MFSLYHSAEIYNDSKKKNIKIECMSHNLIDILQNYSGLLNLIFFLQKNAEKLLQLRYNSYNNNCTQQKRIYSNIRSFLPLPHSNAIYQEGI